MAVFVMPFPLLVLCSVSFASAEIQVIGAGWPRTGTTSLKKALDRLGYKTYHLSDMPNHHIPLWLEIGEAAEAGEPVAYLLSQILQNYTAVVDFPAAAWWDEIHSVYPKAQMISTNRPPTDWYESFSATIISFRHSWQRKWVAKMDARTETHWNMLQHAAFNKVLPEIGMDPSNPENKDEVLAAYSMHNARVRSGDFAEGRFLNWNTTTPSWEGLCEFLNVKKGQCPSGSYPHANSRFMFFARTMLPTTVGLIIIIGMPVFLIGAVLLGVCRGGGTTLEDELRFSKLL